MTPQELQLNDLVLVADRVVKVTALGEYTINGQPATMFHPIPLTTERLEANRFKHKQDWSYSGRDFYAFPNNRVLEYKGFGIEYVNNELFYITDHQLMPLIYFHELQHALRLCGLNEIADGLKIK